MSLPIAMSTHGIHSCLGSRKIQLFRATFVNHQQLVSGTTRLSKGLPHSLLWKATSMRMQMNPGRSACPVLLMAASPGAAWGSPPCVPQNDFGTVLQHIFQCFGQLDLK